MTGAHTLWLTRAEEAHKIEAVRGVRAARRHLGAPDRLVPVVALVQKCIATGKPVEVGRGNEEDVEGGAMILVDVSGGLAEAGIDLTPEQVFATENGAIPPAVSEAPSGDSENVVSAPRPPEAYRSAMVLLALTEGRPNGALAGSNSLKQATGDEEFWTSVSGAILDTFPMIHVLVDDDDDDEG